jgi:hypothetical protein
MKKLLFAFASLALISSAHATDGADIKWNAEMRFRFDGVENAGFVTKSYDNQTVQRTKLGATLTKGEDLTATVSLLQASTWGNNGDTNTSGDFTTDTTESLPWVSEAFVFWKAMDNFAVKVGRGAMDLADGSVVAKNDWLQHPWAFEGALGVYFTEWANVNAFAIKGMNDSATGTADVNFYGVSLDFKNLPEVIKMANLHILQSKATGIDASAAIPTATNVKDSKTRVGVTVKGDAGAIDYRATYAMYSGELESNVGAVGKLDNKASMLDAEVGFGLPDVMAMRISALYHMDSGDGNATDKKLERYDAFFYEQHANAGLMDILNWGNLTYLKAGIALEPMEMTKVGVDYYMFTKSEKADTTVGTANAGVQTTLATKDDLGSEIDIWATKALSNGAELNARIGMFSAGDAFGTTAKDVTDFSLGATFHF